MTTSNEKANHNNKLMADVFGKETSENILAHIEKIYPPFSAFLSSTFSSLYGDDTLNLKTKEIIVLSSLISQKDTKPQLKLHIMAAVKAGVSPKEIYALILHLTIYVGFPATINAINVAKETFDENNINLIP
jgi:4-carboxymuconolactone decarboxylase